MIKTWTEVKDTQLAADISASYRESVVMRRRLKQMLADKVEETRNGSTTKENYSSPNWALLQADAMGFERALKLISSLLD